jgi:hypothetical protein
LRVITTPQCCGYEAAASETTPPSRNLISTSTSLRGFLNRVIASNVAHIARSPGEPAKVQPPKMSYRQTALAVLVLFASVAAACGSDGSGCTCTQCGEEGYTYYCPNNNECYSSLDTCNDDPFGSCSGTCVATKSCHAPLACSPAQQASCGTGTCCINADTFQTFCAPANATCCNWHDNYCPNEAACDPPTGTCLPPQPAQNQTLGCSLCVQAVTYVQNSAEGDVCSAICTFVSTTEPALSAICGKLMNWTGLCGWLEAQIANDVNPQDVCNMVGLCSQAPGTCSCGYCTPAWYGQWCLATPNVCPANSSATARQRTAENHSRRKAACVRVELRSSNHRDGRFCGATKRCHGTTARHTPRNALAHSHRIAGDGCAEK